MLLPDGYTESQVLAAIEEAVAMLAGNFAFGCYSVEDLAQEGRLWALELLEQGRFDPARGSLAGFIYRHLRNRYINFKRDKLRRTDAPCERCARGEPCGPDGQVCEQFAVWAARQDRKASLATTASTECLEDETRFSKVEPTAETEAEIAEVLQFIDARLCPDQRRVLLQMRAGVKVSKEEREAVEGAVREVLEGLRTVGIRSVA